MAKKKNSFTVNGRKYIAKEFDFNAVADFDMMGISIEDFGKKNLALARAYLALYNNNNLAWAGNEIQAHVINGGTLTDLFEVFGNSVADSGFFQAVNKSAEKTAQSGKKEETAEE